MFLLQLQKINILAPQILSYRCAGLSYGKRCSRLTPSEANDDATHINRGIVCIWFLERKVLTSCDLLEMTCEKVTRNKGHDHMLSYEVVQFFMILA